MTQENGFGTKHVYLKLEREPEMLLLCLAGLNEIQIFPEVANISRT